MIINYFYIDDAVSIPFKANPPLVIYANTVLPDSIASQSFQVQTGYSSQVRQ